MKELRAIILAAGKGTRLKSDVPKVLHKVCGKPALSYVTDIVKASGSLKNYVVLGHKLNLVKQILPQGFFPVKQNRLLGTADAVKSAEKYLKSFSGDILILCGDTPLLQKATIKKLIAKHHRSKAECTFLTTVVHEPKGYGRIIRNECGDVLAIREEKDAEGFERAIREINVGVYCIRAKTLFRGLKNIQMNRKKKEFYLTDMIELFRSKEIKIETVETDDPAEGLGINTRQDLAEANRILRSRILDDLMTQGVTIEDPSSTYVEADVKIGRDTVIRPCTFIERHVRIGKACLIGPCARLRPFTKIGNYVEIGNFAEITASHVGDHVFMKHFSYLGDAKVGDRANIGAGVVTANFNGIKKNVTKIGSGAFIGSDSILVAPVSVGKQALTAAGCVLTSKKRVPDGGVAMGVPAKISKRGKTK